MLMKIQLEEMVKDILKIKSAEEVVLQNSMASLERLPEFWSVYDEVHTLFRKNDPTEFGYLDLTRYSLEY